MNIEGKTKYKIIILGDSKTGKTALVEKYADGTFTQNNCMTIGVDLKVREITINDNPIKLYLWDTAGQERFMSIISSYYKNIDGIIILFDLTNVDSFDNLNVWMNEIKKNSNNKDADIIIVGNKADLNNVSVFDNDVNLFIKKHSEYNMSYYKASAKTGLNVDEIFEEMANNIYKYKFTQLQGIKLELENTNTTHLHKKRTSCNCM